MPAVRKARALAPDFELPSARPVIFGLMGGATLEEMEDSLRHVGRQVALGLELPQLRALLRGDWRDRLFAGGALLFHDVPDSVLARVWHAIARGEDDSLFLVFVARDKDPAFATRGERLLAKLWRARARGVVDEVAILKSPALGVCAELVAALPDGPVQRRYAEKLPPAVIGSIREKFFARVEKALKRVR